MYMLEGTLFEKTNNDQFIKTKVYYPYVTRNNGLIIINHRTYLN